MNDAHWPWFILLPDRPDITEIYQLSVPDQQRLMAESSMVSRLLATAFRADKINIAALGNVVPQLHIHHIVRHRNDPAWPAPVWGSRPPLSYTDAARRAAIARLRGSDQDNLLNILD